MKKRGRNLPQLRGIFKAILNFPHNRVYKSGQNHIIFNKNVDFMTHFHFPPLTNSFYFRDRQIVNTMCQKNWLCQTYS